MEIITILTIILALKLFLFNSFGSKNSKQIKKKRSNNLDNNKKYYKDTNGYFRFNDSNIFVHRWMAEKKNKRKLKPGEVVHHRDGNKTNNSFRNLHVCKNQHEHDIIHWSNLKKYGRWHND